MSNELVSVEQVREALPVKFRKSLNDEVLQDIHKMLSDPDMYEMYRDNLVSYTSVLNEGKFKVADYVKAVKYCSFRIMGLAQIDSYKKTFPEKYQRWVANGVLPKDIASYVTAYNKNKMVNKIMAQAEVPFFILNQDLRQKALNHAANLMMNAASEKVQVEALAQVLNHTKPPETAKIELDIGVKESSVIGALREQTLAYARQQRSLIQAGQLTAKGAAESDLITVSQVIEHEG